LFVKYSFKLVQENCLRLEKGANLDILVLKIITFDVIQSILQGKGKQVVEIKSVLLPLSGSRQQGTVTWCLEHDTLMKEVSLDGIYAEKSLVVVLIMLPKYYSVLVLQI
jgi:hypothetical protein